MVQSKLANQILHFTSCDVLKSIIKNDGLHFWASRYDCMNDSLEYRWLYEPLVEKIVRDNPTLKGQVDSLYEIFPYVVSFSGASDHQYFWEKYGENGSGVCLVMNRKIMQPTDEQFAACCPFVKCEEWSKEEEVRYVRIRERNMQVSCSENGVYFSYPQDKKCVKYRDNNGKQVPYLDIVFPKLSLEGILIGKQLNFETTEKTIKTLLQQTGYKNISVEQLMY